MAEATADKWDDLIQQVEALPAETEEDKWDALIQQAEALPADEESLPSKKDEITFLDKAEDFLEDAGENIEEFAYGAEKSRWLGANVYRYAKAGGDEDLLKQREAERIAEKDKKYNLSEERKSSGFSIAGEFLGTLLDPSAFALGHVGVGAKAAQLTAAAQRAANALIVGSVSGADYAVSELSVGEEVNPIAGAASVLLGTGFGAGFVKIIKPTKDSAAKNITANYTEPLLLVQDNKVDAYIDKLNYSFNVENPSRIQALKDTQSNGKKIGAASQIQKVHRLETARRASAKKKNGYTDEQFERITALNKEASLYLKGTGDMLARQAEVVGEGISGVAGKLKEEGTLNANMIRRAVYRPMIGAIAGVGLGYSVNWASDEEMEQDDILYYSMVGLFGGAASKALIKNNQLTSSEVNMATDEVNKIVRANSIGALNFIAAGSASAKANAMGGGVATLGKTLFSQRGANLRGAASTSVEENKDLVLQELNFNWSKVLSESNATKDGSLVNLFSGEAKKLREASYEYAEGFVDSAMLKSKGFSPTEVTTIIHLAKEATSRVGVLTEEVASTGIKMRGRVKDYKLPQFHDINKIAKNETAARQAYKRAYRIQAKADTVAKQYKADQYIDNWVDDMLSGNSSGQHISAFDGKNVFRPLTDHFEKPRMFKDFGARLEIKDFLVKDIDQVYRQYVDNTVPIMEFSRKFGAKGEGILEVKKDIERQFSKALSRANLSEKQTKELKKAKSSQLKAIDGMVDDYFGFLEADSYFAKNPIAQNTAAFFTTGANVARLGKVTITSLADLVQPIQSSGVVASFKALAKQKDFAKETGFAQRDVLGDELRQYALEVKSPGQVIQRSARWVNEKFFKAIGLTKLTSYARKFAYNAGVERGFTVANKIAKGRSGTAVRNEANSLGISDEYAKTLSKFKSVEEAFEDADGNRILNMIGTKSADRDALIPQISNRRGFAKSNDPVIKGLSLFLSWAQAKATQTNSLITRMEDGHDILFVRTLGAIAVVNGIETFKSWLSDPTGSALELDQETYADQYATLENFGKAAGRTGNFNHYLIDKVAQLAAGGHRSDLDDLWPALDWMTDAAKSAIPIAANVEYGDIEGAMVQASKIAPLGREIKAGVEYVTGELYEDVPNRSSKTSSRVAYEKGGEVLDVPNTSKEPDERIDKMTGMPYNQQAGTAFTDVEDREDPLQRMGFGLGSLVGRFAGKALKSVDDDIVEEVPLKTTDEIIEENQKISKALEEDAISSPDDTFLKSDIEKENLNMNETRSGFFGFGKKPKVEKDEESPLPQSLDEVADNLSLNTEGKSLQEITRYVGSKGLEEGKEDYKIIAEKVANQLDALEGQGFSFSFNIARLKKGSTTSLEKPAPASVVEGSAAGMARMDNKKVYVDINDLKPRDSLGNGLNNETILHESIHAATMTAIKAGRFDSQKGTKLYKDVEELDKLYSHVAKQFNERSKSGNLNEFETKYFRRMNNTLANGDELVSWGLTNRDMQKYLEGIKYKNTNAWTAFVQKIRDILGLSPKQDTVLSELLRVSDNLLSADAKQLSSVVDKVVRKHNNKGGKVLSSLQRNVK